MAEIKRLDAGKWFKPEFAGQRIQTFQEAIDLVRGKAGLYPELKSPELYRSRNVDQVKLFVDIIRKNGLEKPESLKTTPVIIQSFDESAIRRVAVDLPTVPRVFLTSKDEDVTEARIRELAKFATGIAPEKFVIARHPEMVARAHAAGLTVTSWTFRADDKEMKFPNVREEMSHFLYDARDRRAVHQQPGSVSAALDLRPALLPDDDNRERIGDHGARGPASAGGWRSRGRRGRQVLGTDEQDVIGLCVERQRLRPRHRLEVLLHLEHGGAGLFDDRQRAVALP